MSVVQRWLCVHLSLWLGPWGARGLVWNSTAQENETRQLVLEIMTRPVNRLEDGEFCYDSLSRKIATTAPVCIIFDLEYTAGGKREEHYFEHDKPMSEFVLEVHGVNRIFMHMTYVHFIDRYRTGCVSHHLCHIVYRPAANSVRSDVPASDYTQICAPCRPHTSTFEGTPGMRRVFFNASFHTRANFSALGLVMPNAQREMRQIRFKSHEPMWDPTMRFVGFQLDIDCQVSSDTSSYPCAIRMKTVAARSVLPIQNCVWSRLVDDNPLRNIVFKAGGNSSRGMTYLCYFDTTRLEKKFRIMTEVFDKFIYYSPFRYSTDGGWSLVRPLARFFFDCFYTVVVARVDDYIFLSRCGSVYDPLELQKMMVRAVEVIYAPALKTQQTMHKAFMALVRLPNMLDAMSVILRTCDTQYCDITFGSVLSKEDFVWNVCAERDETVRVANAFCLAHYEADTGRPVWLESLGQGALCARLRPEQTALCTLAGQNTCRCCCLSRPDRPCNLMEDAAMALAFRACQLDQRHGPAMRRVTQIIMVALCQHFPEFHNGLVSTAVPLVGAQRLLVPNAPTEYVLSVHMQDIMTGKVEANGFINVHQPEFVPSVRSAAVESRAKVVLLAVCGEPNGGWQRADLVSGCRCVALHLERRLRRVCCCVPGFARRLSQVLTPSRMLAHSLLPAVVARTPPPSWLLYREQVDHWFWAARARFKAGGNQRPLRYGV